MFSYQLYSSRNFPPLSATLRMLADAGYGAVEGYGALYANDALVKELGAALSDTGLSMPTGHFSLAMLNDDAPKVLDIARSLGMQRLYCPHLMPDERPSDATGWRAFGARLETVAKPYRDAGLGFGWHNHDFEFAGLPDGTIPQAAIFDGGPGLEWEIDVAWVIRGGADPIDWIRKYADRITAAHVKDIAPKGANADEDGWADVGHGTVDWKSIMSALRTAGCTHFVMEHDNPSDPVRFATRSIKATEKL